MNKLPYNIQVKVSAFLEFNTNYDPEAICTCGHPYHRHFDSYANNEVVGCKYCECFKFEPQIKVVETNERILLANEYRDKIFTANGLMKVILFDAIKKLDETNISIKKIKYWVLYFETSYNNFKNESEEN